MKFARRLFLKGLGLASALVLFPSLGVPDMLMAPTFADECPVIIRVPEGRDTLKYLRSHGIVAQLLGRHERGELFR